MLFPPEAISTLPGKRKVLHLLNHLLHNMSEQAQLIPEKIHFREFRIVKAQVNSPVELKIKQIKEFRSEVGLEMAFNLAKCMVKADIQVTASTVLTHKNKAEADTFFHIAFFFEVENLTDLAKEKNPGHLDINGGLANAIASISYSTARGILLTRLQGTALREFILPVINPNDLLK